MIFVAVGNPHNPSMRTLNAVEKLAVDGFFEQEPVIIQSGNNPDFKPRVCKATSFMDMEEFARNVAAARIVICHAGAGTLSHVLSTGKTPVVVPRRLKYGEHIDDHQMELLEAFASKKLLIPAYEVDELPGAILEAAKRPLIKVELGKLGREMVEQAIDDLLARS